MGGSGGNFPTNEDPRRTFEKIQKEQERSKDAEFEIEVNQLIADTLKDANSRDVEQTRTHINTILTSINKEIDGNVQTIFGGSVAKHTYVDGLSDIDVLVIVNDTELKQFSPGEVKEYIKERMEKRLPFSEIKIGEMAVTVSFTDGIEIQVLPAIRTKSGVKISSSNGENWSSVVRPKAFAEKLVKVNQKCANKVVPVIKLAKSIVSDFPSSRQLKGYHIESLAVKIFSNYSGDMVTKTMLKHFFSRASEHVLSSIQDKTGQTLKVDGYLGGNGSVERRIVSDSLARMSRKMESADRSGNLEKWGEIL